MNNTTCAFKRTGLFPFSNPFSESWTDTIGTIGQGKPPNAMTNYEIFSNENAQK